jgi:hypothetical protein
LQISGLAIPLGVPLRAVEPTSSEKSESGAFIGVQCFAGSAVDVHGKPVGAALV